MNLFRRHRKLPGLLLGMSVAAAALWLSWGRVRAASEDFYSQMQLFSQVVSLIKSRYVDDVDPHKLVEGAISGMMESLDPHSTYMPKQRYARFSEDFRGNYSGIGIEFEIRDKYITVIAPIEGSPSYRLGVRPGDRILKIDGQSAYGLTTEEVFGKLRGPDGSKVHVTLGREGEDDPIELDIVRERVPIYSVPYHFMVEPGTGYIRMIRFSNTTERELDHALEELQGQGMKRLVLDLRGNGGGLLNQAADVVEKFVPAGERTVYTRGRTRDSNSDYFSGEGNKFLDFPMVVLVDHGSASASEVVSGALQDLDRALVVGLPTFGKGLVQNQLQLPDSSAILLTVARYYTPSGRLIQRDYSDRQAYLHAAMEDSAAPADTQLAKRPKFKTVSGRTVYGGGGITPDVFDPPPPRYTKLMVALVGQRQFFEFASHWVPKHPNDVNRADPDAFVQTWKVPAPAMDEFLIFAKAQVAKDSKEEFTPAEWAADMPNIENYLKAEIGGVLWDRNTLMRVLVQRDTQLSRAVDQFAPARDLMVKFATHYNLKAVR
ncbi:MAG TPA: S41 family peptidase [Candidatus Saccharimonadales bacterium]|nr:S41 family peptidase [Candidatus Saccharimonadales bacterium]